MRQLAWARLRRAPGRYVACGLAVALAVGFAVFVQLLGDGVSQVVRAGESASIGGADVAVQVDWSQPGADELAAAVSVLPQVHSASRTGTAFSMAELPRAAGLRPVMVAAVPPAGDLRWPELSAGRWPERAGEAVVTDSGEAGDEVVLVADTEPVVEGTEVPPTSFDVVGVAEVGLAADFPFTGLFVSEPQAVQLGAGTMELLVAGAAGVTEQELLTAVEQVAASTVPGASVVPADDVREQRELGSRSLVLMTQGALGAFVALAVAVAVLVVSNTYSVLLAQRVREQALLRCLGATRRDLWRGGLTEAALVGLAAGTAALLTGWGLGLLGWLAAARWLPAEVAVPVPSVLTVLLALGLGAATAMLSAVLPLLRAGSVSPLAALRPVEAVPESARTSRARVVLGCLLLLVGGAGTAFGAFTASVGLALPAALLAFLGVLLVGGLLLPRVAALLAGAVGRVGGPAAALAAASTGRNPRRTAATASAVLIGMTFAVTAAVGASSMRATTEAYVGGSLPVDATVSARDLDDAGMAALVGELSSVAGVESAAAGRSLMAEVSPDRPDGSVPGAVDMAWSEVWSGSVQEVLPEADLTPDGGSVVLAAAVADQLSVRTGDIVTVLPDGAAAGSGRSLVVLVDEDSPLEVLLAPTTAEALAATPTALLSFDEKLGAEEAEDAVDAITKVALGATPRAVVDSPVLGLGQVQQIFDVLLAVVGGMLAVTVTIALVGVSNTLSLSLVERGQENALLRALGLSRSRLRAMVAWEALVLGLVGATVGVTLGVGFGVAGTYSLMGAEGEVVVDVPWLLLLALATGVGAVAVAASLWPAHRASAVSPASALGATV